MKKSKLQFLVGLLLVCTLVEWSHAFLDFNRKEVIPPSVKDRPLFERAPPQADPAKSDAGKPDLIKDAAKPDLIKDAAKPDLIKDAAKPDLIKDAAAKPDLIKDSATKELQKDVVKGKDPVKDDCVKGKCDVPNRGQCLSMEATLTCRGTLKV
jgi:hypothetical protein